MLGNYSTGEGLAPGCLCFSIYLGELIISNRLHDPYIRLHKPLINTLSTLTPQSMLLIDL